MVRLAADECCDAVLVSGLRADGHDVWYAMESSPGADDRAVLQHGHAEQRILLTEDKDFGELVVRLGLPAYGVLLLRMNPTDSRAKLVRLRQVLEKHESRLPGSFVVVDESKTRFRPLSLSP